MSNLFAVFGNPIAHSKSPEIHRNFAHQFDLEIDYQKRLADEDNFQTEVKAFFENGAIGCNVTVPFKEQAWRLSHELSPQASRARAVNTLFRNNSDQICGHNTDGVGLVKDLLHNHNIELSGKHITILGAGGATRGILEPLIQCTPASIQLINRTHQRALDLAADFADLFAVHVASNDSSAANSDILINATSASLGGQLPSEQESLISANTICYDLTYAAEPTAFINWAAECGAKQCHDGLGMLIEQAAVSFQTWTGLSPDTKELIQHFQ